MHHGRIGQIAAHMELAVLSVAVHAGVQFSAAADGGSESPQHFLANGVQGDGSCLGKASVHGLAKLLLVGSKMGF